MVSGAKAPAPPACCQALLASPIPGIPFIAIHSEHGVLSAIDFVPSPPPVSPAVDEVAAQAAALLTHYFSDCRTSVPPLQPAYGTPFQRRVWQLLQQIPAGETRRYGELASQLGSSAQAVAGACRANPLTILIPCHRVVAATGLGGYMGQLEGEALEIKRWLLHYEGHV
jgi:methylated-DNA-[protein]-cysteine S-methyltransferase